MQRDTIAAVLLASCFMLTLAIVICIVAIVQYDYTVDLHVGPAEYTAGHDAGQRDDDLNLADTLADPFAGETVSDRRRYFDTVTGPMYVD